MYLLYVHKYLRIYTHIHTLYLGTCMCLYLFIIDLLYGTVEVVTNFIFNPADSCCKLSAGFICIYLV